MDDVARIALDAYLQDGFAATAPVAPPAFPLPDEPHIADWQEAYCADGDAPAAFARLRAALAQLQLPVRAGLKETEAYRAVMRRGEPVDAAAVGGTLDLPGAKHVTLHLVSHPLAGTLPVITAPDHDCFRVLVQALACRHEPEPVRDAVNAMLITGIRNWDRVHRYRDAWLAAQPAGDWGAELQRAAAAEPWRFSDTVMLLTDAPYSGCTATALGLPLSAGAWRVQSLVIRREHEFHHYLTRRLHGRMRNHLLDELLADRAGLLAAHGAYDPSLARAFLGLEADGSIRPAGRFFTYCTGLPAATHRPLAAAAGRAIANLASLPHSPATTARDTVALTLLTLAELAADDAGAHAAAAQQRAQHWYAVKG